MNEKYREVCERLDWRVMVDDNGCVELEKFSPAGEDFIVSVSAENFVENVRSYADGFDEDEHIEMWIEARRSGRGGIPSTKRLAIDAEAIQDMLDELADALEEAQEDEQE